MTSTWMTRKIFIAATLACAAALISVALGYPAPIKSPVLGTGWHCRASVFMTSCTHVGHIERSRSFQDAADARRI